MVFNELNFELNTIDDELDKAYDDYLIKKIEDD